MKAALIAAVALALAACATTQPGTKPILTEAATKEALAACHASGGRFFRTKAPLPSFSVRSRESEIGSDSPTPTQTCMYQRLQSYRYDMMALDDPHSSAD